MSLRRVFRGKRRSGTRKELRGTNQMLIEALIFCFQEELAPVLLMLAIPGRRSGTGTELSLPGQELESSEDYRRKY